ncbi:MAG: hypothetical protein VW338_00840 [Rhodospirillaceae bacterium]
MATHLGNEGAVYVGANQVAEVSEFQVTETAQAVDDSAIGDEWDTALVGSKAWRGSMTCHWDETDTNGQEALSVGAQVTLNLYPEGSAGGDVKLTGAVIVTEVGLASRRNGVISRSISFQGNGALTHTTV